MRRILTPSILSQCSEMQYTTSACTCIVEYYTCGYRTFDLHVRNAEHIIKAKLYVLGVGTCVKIPSHRNASDVDQIFVLCHIKHNICFIVKLSTQTLLSTCTREIEFYYVRAAQPAVRDLRVPGCVSVVNVFADA